MRHPEYTADWVEWSHMRRRRIAMAVPDYRTVAPALDEWTEQLTRCTPTDRALLVLLASRVRAWRQALLVVQPDTLLRWHRAGFRAFWRRKSRPGPGRPPLPAETVALIRQMAAENPLWGAERIRSELRKLGLGVARRTVQRHMRAARPP